MTTPSRVPPSGGSLEIGNLKQCDLVHRAREVPPSGGSLEIGNLDGGVVKPKEVNAKWFPLRGDP